MCLEERPTECGVITRCQGIDERLGSAYLEATIFMQMITINEY